MFKTPSFSLFPLVAVVLLGGNAFGQTSNNVVCARHGFREDLQQGVVLTATSNAPAGAAGRARIVAINDNGTNTSVLFVKTTGLTNGAYSVSLTQLGDTNITSLGSLNVASSPGCFRFGFGFGHGRRFGHGHGDGHGHGFGNAYGHGHDDGDDDDGDEDDGVSSTFTNWMTRCSKTDSAFKHLVCGGGETDRKSVV